MPGGGELLASERRSRGLSQGLTELVTGHEGSSYFLGADLGHVEDDDGTDESDTETSNETTGDDETKLTVEGGLKNDTDQVDEATGDDGGTTTDVVGEVASDEST